MALDCIIPSADWDFPTFKVLAKNDTGNAKGHQGGIVIPKDLRPFFPGLTGTATAANPTIDRRLEAHLFVENNYKATVSTRYQYQTWGGTRSPESRLTDQLGPLRNAADEKDILVIQRSIDRLDRYRLTLVRRTSSEHSIIAALTAGRNWGVLNTALKPISETDLLSARREEKKAEAKAFSLFDKEAAFVTTKQRKVARSIVFRETVLDEYGEVCAACGEGLRSQRDFIEVDAAHVVPRHLTGADDARNGLALCKRHHWAFDEGLFGFSDARTILVPAAVLQMTQNAPLSSIQNKPMREAKTTSLRVHDSALEWHRNNKLVA